LPIEQQEKAIENEDLLAVARCVKSWSFETKFTLANVQKLLINSPFIFELVNQSVMDRSKFLG
jgi:hypothetical protein